MPNNNYQGWYHIGAGNPAGNAQVGGQGQAAAGNAQVGIAPWNQQDIQGAQVQVVNAPDWEADPAPPPPVQDGHDFINQLFEEAKAKKMYGKNKPKGAQPFSLTCAEYQDLVTQTTLLEGLIRQESGELEHVLETISTQVEVVRDIGSTIRTHISSLQKAAIQLERWRQTMPQPSSPGSETGPVVDRSAPAGDAPPVQAGVQQVAPGLFVQDQG